ncbi:MAG: 16S rRNA (guanine(527)-N(7))-methyltransferase RsmG [Cytophagales bacterium]|nr:16S rRNA (guanine(527)-N(7))-methyltransferase RsmG [Cytophagales bacterium]
MDSSIISKYFLDLSDIQKEQFNRLGELYLDWNQKINVISRKDMDAFYERHVLHSLAIAKFISFTPDTKIQDVGTGGGFPGIPLAILLPEVNFHLVDSVGKKIKVVNAVAESIGIENLTAEHARMEQLKGSYDFVVSRAVASTRQLMDWTKHLISKDNQNELTNGWIFLKGGDLTNEMTETRLPYQMNALSDYYSEEFFDTKQIIYMSN